METMRCYTCGNTFDRNDAPPSQRHLSAYYCKPCKSKLRKESYWKNVSSEREYSKKHQRKLRLKRVYGLTEEKYVEMCNEQNGVCAICEAESPRLVIDHDHVTGKVRQLLCDNCNRGIGLLKDNPEVVQKAAEYLRKHSFAEIPI